MERIARRAQTELDGAGKLAIQHEKLDDPARRNAAVPLAVHLEGRGGAQHGPPLDMIEGGSHVLGRAEEDVVFDVQDAGNLVGALEHPADLCKVPARPVRHRGVGDAGNAYLQLP